MRYFLVTFSLKNKHSIGSITIELDKFPSHAYIEKLVAKELGYTTQIIVQSFFEFKDRNDYKNYKGDTDEELFG